MGREFLDDALPVDIEREGVRVTGFAGLPTLHRPDPGQQYLFVNGRPVQGQAADRRRARGLRRPAAARGAIPLLALFVDASPARGRRQRAPEQGRGALPRCGPRARAGRRRAAAGAAMPPAIAPPPRAARTTLDALARGADRAGRAARRPAAAPPYAPGSAEQRAARGLRRGQAGPARGPRRAQRGCARRRRAAAGGPARPAARRRARAAARDLHRGADAHVASSSSTSTPRTSASSTSA